MLTNKRMKFAHCVRLTRIGEAPLLAAMRGVSSQTMSAWRRKALELFPDLRNDIEDPDTSVMGRRLVESDVFGLYDSGPMSLEHALNVYRMFEGASRGEDESVRER